MTMSQVTEIKAAINIADIIGERLQLQSTGASLRALCPFHHEKSPSFYVSEELQRFKCFGCGASGDVIEFLQQFENMTFTEALQILADKAGIKLESYKKSPQDQEREIVLDILDLAKEYYHYLLRKHKVGQKALTYFKSRAVSFESINIFELGYAPNNWDNLLKFLHLKKKYSLANILAAGLIIKTKTNRYYDRFRGRIMFPLKNHRGQVVGFSGRVLDPKIKEAKYINSPETLVYHKSEMLFGYHELFREIKKKKEVIVVEGEVDVITSSQNHVNHIVAIKGSALTKQQAKLLERVAERVLLSLDSDNAGVNATKRAIEVLKDTKLQLRVIDISKLPGGYKDPDELIRANPKLWRETVKKSISVYDFFIKASLSNHDKSTAEGKRAIVEDLANILFDIKSAVEQDFYLQKLAKLLIVDLDILKKDINRFAKGQASLQVAKQEKSQEIKLDHDEKLKRYLLFLYFQFTKDLMKRYYQDVSDLQFKVTGISQILQKINQVNFDLTHLATSLDADLKNVFFELRHDPSYLEITNATKLHKEFQQIFQQVLKKNLLDQINYYQQKISFIENKEVKETTDQEKLDKYLQKIVLLQSKLK